MERRGGIGSNFLTRYNGPSISLLKTVGGRPTRGSGTLVAGAAPRGRPPATEDEPQSSTDETDDTSCSLPPLEPGGFDQLGRRRAKGTRDTKRYGKKPTTPQVDATAGEGAAASTTQGGSIPKAPPRRSTRKAPVRSSSPKRTLDDVQGVDDAHLRDEFGFVGSSQTQKKAKRTNTYGSQGQSSQRSRRPGFMNPVDRHSFDALDKLENSDASGSFKDPSKKFAGRLQAQIPGEEESTSAFRMPRDVPLDILSSSQEDKGHEFKMPLNVPLDMLSSSQEVPKTPPLSPRKFKMPVGLSPARDDTRNTRGAAKAVLGGKGWPVELRKIPNDSDAILSNDSLTQVSNSSSSSPLSSPPDSPTFASSQEAQDGFAGKRDIFVDSYTARCPMCREVVDASLLRSFSDGLVMNVRRQTKFCREHKQNSAKVEWGTRGYPDIKWDNLQSRIEKYYSELEDILEGRTASYFKESLEANFKSGKNRTLVQSMMSSDFRSLTPGYYGSRGARIMMDSIMLRFTDRIRKLAPKDRLISSGGISNFVQSVMVPELAVLLVREDMGLDSDMARKVMMDSIDIGDLLNDDDEDELR